MGRSATSRILPRRRQVRMTREEFEHWFANRKGANAVYIRGPFDLVPCDCRDINCHGWRFVERPRAPQ